MPTLLAPIAIPLNPDHCSDPEIQIDRPKSTETTSSILAGTFGKPIRIQRDFGIFDENRNSATHTVGTQTDDKPPSILRGNLNRDTTSLETMEHRGKRLDRNNVLDSDPHDLPSYPIVGLKDRDAVGAAAASLAHATAKPVEIWKPSPVSAASAAASLAHAHPKPVTIWRPSPGSPASLAALHAVGERPKVSPFYTTPEASKRWSLTGAIEAMHAVNDIKTGAPSFRSDSRRTELAFQNDVQCDLEHAGVPNQDKVKSDILKAAATSMAKGSRLSSKEFPEQRYSAVSSTPLNSIRRPATMSAYQPSLETATERSAGIGEYDEATTISRDTAQLRGAQASLSRSGDHREAQQAEDEISGFQQSSSEINRKKRGQNALMLMAAAQRNVRDQMSSLDEQIADSRGLIRKKEWEKRAAELAQAASDRRLQNYGKIYIGGGGHVTPEALQAIARRNVLPVLEDVDRRAEAGRTKIEAEKAAALEKKLDLEEEKRVRALHMAWERESQEVIKRARELQAKQQTLKLVIEKQMAKMRRDRGTQISQKRTYTEKRYSKRPFPGKFDVGRGREPMARSPERLSPSYPDEYRREVLRSPTPVAGEYGRGFKALVNRIRGKRSSRIVGDGEVQETGDSSSSFVGGYRARQLEGDGKSTLPVVRQRSVLVPAGEGERYIKRIHEGIVPAGEGQYPLRRHSIAALTTRDSVLATDVTGQDFSTEVVMAGATFARDYTVEGARRVSAPIGLTYSPTDLGDIGGIPGPEPVRIGESSMPLSSSEVVLNKEEITAGVVDEGLLASVSRTDPVVPSGLAIVSERNKKNNWGSDMGAIPAGEAERSIQTEAADSGLGASTVIEKLDTIKRTADHSEDAQNIHERQPTYLGEFTNATNEPKSPTPGNRAYTPVVLNERMSGGSEGSATGGSKPSAEEGDKVSSSGKLGSRFTENFG
ncbi:Eisosome assembly protein [Rhizina undulata]